MKAVILAGGFGTRLAEETSILPKPMVRIGTQPIIWHIMKTYAHYGITDFVICLGYKGDVIRDYFLSYRRNRSNFTIDLGTGDVETHGSHAEDWRVTLVETGLNTMTGGRLKAVRDFLGDEDFCMTYGDGVGDVDVGRLVAFHRQHGRQATVTSVVAPSRYGVLDVAESGQVRGFIEKPAMNAMRINAGYFVLSPSVIDRIPGPSTVWEQGPLTSLAHDGELMDFDHTGFWLGMDSLREKQVLERLWQSGQAPWAAWRDGEEQ